MLFRRLNIRLAVNFAFLLGMAMLLQNAVIIHSDKKLLLKTEISKAGMLLRGIENSMTASGTSLLITADSLVNSLPGEMNVSSLLVTDLQGKEIRSFGKNPETLPELRQLLQEVRKTGRPLTRFSGITWGIFWTENKYLMTASPVKHGNRLIAVAGLAMPLAHIYLELRKSQSIMMIYILINVLLISILGLYRFSGIIRKPLLHLVKRAEEYKDEEDEIFFLSDRDSSEFSQLSKALNRMLYRISSGKDELKSMVRSLEKANRDLKKAQNDIINAEKLASVGRLSAGIAHEIGNPIAIVIGYLDLLKREDISEEEKGEFIRRTESEVNRINTIIRQLLDFSRPSDGNMKEVQVHEIIRDTVAMFRYQPLMSDIDLQPVLSAENDRVKADPAQLRQIFLNLMINAADAIFSAKKEAGELRICTATEMSEGKNGAAPLPMLRIDFQDNGAGIAEKHLDNIFEPFYTTKEPGKGTGLGLSVCYMIIDAMGGKIRAESQEDKGTALIIHLPVLQETVNYEH